MAHHRPSTVCPQAQEDDGQRVRRQPHRRQPNDGAESAPEHHLLQMGLVFWALLTLQALAQRVDLFAERSQVQGTYPLVVRRQRLRVLFAAPRLGRESLHAAPAAAPLTCSSQQQAASHCCGARACGEGPHHAIVASGREVAGGGGRLEEAAGDLRGASGHAAPRRSRRADREGQGARCEGPKRRGQATKSQAGKHHLQHLLAKLGPSSKRQLLRKIPRAAKPERRANRSWLEPDS
mmetsp:Transcript_74640/g.242513  ORF Transcript_74640/g.242513 Transcript_74640/m.242513 type:complete len:236 (-) Transcript_74640:2-709(-)